MLDIPATIEKRLSASLFGDLDANQLADPFWFYAHLMEEIAQLQDVSVWTIRDRVREMETRRTPAGKPNPNYRDLHDIARHAIHVIETLDVAGKTMGSVLAEHQDFMTSSTEPSHVSKDIHRRLLFFEHLLLSLRHRSASNKERLLNEIHLAYNTVAQYDSGISVKIGQAAQSDSAAMKMVAFVTLTFLPPTFISAIFSMSFFSYDADSGHWSVSEKLWLYWVFAIPTTLATSLLWFLWRQAHPPALVGTESEDTGVADVKSGLSRGIKLLTGGTVA